MKQTIYTPDRVKKKKSNHRCWSDSANWVSMEGYVPNEVVLCDCGKVWIVKSQLFLSFHYKMRRLQPWRMTYWRIDRTEA